MPYRDASSPADEILDTFGVLEGKGGELVGLLGALAICGLVALGVSVFVGMPPGVRPWLWTMPVATLVFGVPAVMIYVRRRRELHLVRSGPRVRLIVPGALELELPLVLSGDQLAMDMGGLTMHHVFLKLVDGNGRGLLLNEVRGAIHGALEGWFDVVDKATPAASYDVRAAGELVRIRARIEALNAELRGATA